MAEAAVTAVGDVRGRRGQSFRNGSFYDRDFSGQDLTRADFRGAVLHNCKFDNCDLTYADFEGADCTKSSFRQSRLYRTSFKDAVLAKCILDPRDMFGTTITIHCNTVEGVKAGPLWLAGWLQYVLMMDISQDLREKVTAVGESLIGDERFKSVQRVFCRRDI